MKLTGNKCRCTGCGELFRSVYAFDRHRRGPYTDRRCLSITAMSGEGFTKDARGFWMTAGLATAPRREVLAGTKEITLRFKGVPITFTRSQS